MRENIIIIGGGVSGITTALTLQLMGYKTVIYAEHLVNKQAPADPKFASLYPAASVIPHSVQSENLQLLFPASLAVFGVLHRQRFKSIEIHRHFEVFEFPVEFPAYTPYLPNFSSIDTINPEEIPHRPDAAELQGWVFNCFITQWPKYIQQMYELYKEAGGTIHQQKITSAECSELAAEVIVNCSGVWSDELFPDRASKKLIRGHLIHILNQEPVTSSNRQPISYNYTPNPSVYATPEGTPSDVYFYPVDGKWILGGSRQTGRLDDNSQWKGAVHTDAVAINDMEIPQPILELNDEILAATYNRKIPPTKQLQPFCGYRFSRDDQKNGLRLESTQEYGKKVIHNYGHGGAGVTLSWGCALEVLHLLGEDVKLKTARSKTYNTLLKNLQVRLHELYLRYY